MQPGNPAATEETRSQDGNGPSSRHPACHKLLSHAHRQSRAKDTLVVKQAGGTDFSWVKMGLRRQSQTL